MTELSFTTRAPVAGADVGAGADGVSRKCEMFDRSRATYRTVEAEALKSTTPAGYTSQEGVLRNLAAES